MVPFSIPLCSIPLSTLYSTVFNEKKMKTYSWRLFRNQRVFLLFKYSLKDFDFESRFLYSVFFILSLYSTIISDTQLYSILYTRYLDLLQSFSVLLLIDLVGESYDNEENLILYQPVLYSWNTVCWQNIQSHNHIC